MFNNENFENEFIGAFDRQEHPILPNEIKGVYYEVIDRVVRENFKKIEANAIDIEGIKLLNPNDKRLKRLINNLIGILIFMLDWFTESEEYEKCSVIKKYLDELKEA